MSYTNRTFSVAKKSFDDYSLVYLTWSRYENDWPSTMHFHSFTEFMYIVSGTGTLHLDGGSQPLREGDLVNLERSMRPDALLDGHIVQGHVDQTARCTAITEADGSWYYTFEYDSSAGNITVEKGSVAVNGVSLTVVNSQPDSFQVAIIPYTHEHTNFHTFRVGTTVNLEFDIVGKYITKLMQLYRVK